MSTQSKVTFSLCLYIIYTKSLRIQVLYNILCLNISILATIYIAGNVVQNEDLHKQIWKYFPSNSGLLCGPTLVPTLNRFVLLEINFKLLSNVCFQD